MLRLPRNLHLVPTSRSADNAMGKNTQHDTSKVLRMPRKMTSEVFKVLRLPRRMLRIVWKCSQSIAPATQNDFWRVVKHVGMSQSATPATQNDMTTFSDTSKKSRFCDFRHGNFEATTVADGRLQTVADGCDRLRTVADGCGRLRTVADARSRVTRTRVNPQTPKCKTRTLRYAFGKKNSVVQMMCTQKVVFGNSKPLIFTVEMSKSMRRHNARHFLVLWRNGHAPELSTHSWYRLGLSDPTAVEPSKSGNDPWRWATHGSFLWLIITVLITVITPLITGISRVHPLKKIGVN